MDLQIQAAFENEFYLLKRIPDASATDAVGPILPPVPADQTLFAATLAMDAHRVVIDEIADALAAQGMPVEQYYPESGPGQQEMTIRYTDALAAVKDGATGLGIFSDTMLHSREGYCTGCQPRSCPGIEA